MEVECCACSCVQCTHRVGWGTSNSTCIRLHREVLLTGLHVQLTVVLTLTSGVGSGWAFSGALPSTVAKANCSQQGPHNGNKPNVARNAIVQLKLGVLHTDTGNHDWVV